jgi:hypothetical protein
MEWKTVESSQIAEVGYGVETQTLGIRFKPTKSQPQGSEYRYALVPPQVCADLMNAESIGKYFAEHIKAHPETYPYRKIEPEA